MKRASTESCDALEQQSPTFLAPRTSFIEEFFHRPGMGGGFRMIRAHYIYYALYFYYYYISFTSDLQTLDPGEWGPYSRG